MNVEINIIALALLLAAVLVTAFLLPMIWQLKKTGRKADILLAEIQRELLPTLRDCREIAERLKHASLKIEKGSAQTENLLAALEELSVGVRRITHIIRQDACFAVENAAGLILGLKAACRVLFKETRKKGD